MNNFTVDILTPNKVVARSIPAENVVIPTQKGQIEVMKDHTHVVEKLETGIVSILGSAEDPDRHFLVTVGICKVLNDKITILSNTSEEQHEVDLERAELSLKNAQEMLQNTLSDDELTKYRRKAERAGLRIQLAKRVK